MTIVDDHVHIGIPFRPAFGTDTSYKPDDLLRDMDRAGVSISVVLGIPHAYDNDWVAKAASDHPDRLVPCAYMDPWHFPDPSSALKRYKDMGFVSIKLRAVSLRYGLGDRTLLDPIFAACEENGLMVCMHTGEDPTSTPLQAENLARAFPNVTVLLFHSGFRTLAHEAIECAKRTPNIYLEQAAGTSLQTKEAVAAIGPERVIYGSDAPYMDTRVEIKRIEAAVPDAKDRELVLGGNILRLLGRTV